MRHSVQLLARIVKYELFRRAPPVPPVEAPRLRSPLVPSLSAHGLTMLPLQGTPGATPVLDRLQHFISRDGRCVVMLACACELFAVKDALRTCPFEACAGVYTASAARVLALVAHEWHVHGPPARNAADGWMALIKLAETLAEVCSRGDHEVYANTAPTVHLDGGAVATALAGLRAGLEGPWGRRLGEALPSLMRHLVASGPPQSMVNHKEPYTLNPV
jgi:hypothetical protein